MTHDPHPPGTAAIIVAGPPGSGKTTLATSLAGTLGWVIADIDAVTGAVARAALELAGVDETALDGAAGRQLRAARYEALVAVATANLAIGLGVILAAPFTAELRDGGRWRALAQRLQAADPSAGHAALVYVDCPPDLRWERLRSRGAARDRGKLALAPADSRPAADVPTIVIDATRSLAGQVGAVLAGIAPPIAAPDPSPC